MCRMRSGDGKALDRGDSAIRLAIMPVVQGWLGLVVTAVIVTAITTKATTTIATITSTEATTTITAIIATAVATIATTIGGCP